MNNSKLLKPNPGAYRRLDTRKIRERWDSRADTWDICLDDSDCHLNIENAYQNFLLFSKQSIMEHSPGGLSTVLDLCCGTAIVSDHLKDTSKSIVGIDLSFQMVSKARKKNISNVLFTVGDCFYLPFAESAFEAVVSRGVILSHYEKKYAPIILKNISSVLAVDGLLLIDFLNIGGKGKHSYSPVGKTLYDIKDIHELFKVSGLQLVKYEGNDYSRTIFVSGRRIC